MLIQMLSEIFRDCCANRLWILQLLKEAVVMLHLKTGLQSVQAFTCSSSVAGACATKRELWYYCLPRGIY